MTPTVITVSSDAVDITMETPTPGVSENGEFYYDIQYIILPDGAVVVTDEVSVPGGGAYTQRVSGLTQGNVYIFEVRARNPFGASGFVSSQRLSFNGEFD